MKISIIGTEHMAQSLSFCLERMGHLIVSLNECDVCWIAIDTSINEKGEGDLTSVYGSIRKVKPQLKDGTLVIVSSQIPVGTSQKFMEMLGDGVGYAVMPEHMRMGKGVYDFINLERVFVGIGDEKYKTKVLEVFNGKEVVFVSIPTAEMIKHAVNAFLATSASFINDISDLCEKVGANITDVTKALKSDYRIGKDAYLDASIGYSGGHFERDINYLQDVAKEKNVNLLVINAVKEKNESRREKIIEKLVKI